MTGIRHRFCLLTITALAAACAVTAGAQVAAALWTNSAPVSNADLHSGTVVLHANGSATATIPAAITPQLGATTTTHVPITMSNTGNLPLDYRLDNLTGTASDPALLTTGLTIRIGAASSASACSSGSNGTQIPLTTGSSLLGAAFVTRRGLVAGAADVLCISLTAPSAMSAGFRSGTATLTLQFQAQNQ